MRAGMCGTGGGPSEGGPGHASQAVERVGRTVEPARLVGYGRVCREVTDNVVGRVRGGLSRAGHGSGPGVRAAGPAVCAKFPRDVGWVQNTVSFSGPRNDPPPFTRQTFVEMESNVELGTRLIRVNI